MLMIDAMYMNRKTRNHISSQLQSDGYIAMTQIVTTEPGQSKITLNEAESESRGRPRIDGRRHRGNLLRA